MIYNLDQEKDEDYISISNFEDTIEHSMMQLKQESLNGDSILECDNILLTEEEVSELKSTLKVKVDEIISKRDNSERENEKKHDIVMFAIPSQENK